ncbi:hypothetical protein CDL15_Pgr025324 [Punica granatum]|uniref:Uncharacterized protein n=1 Tax=Punica granatum TaxID=22663 RepID=A0A218W8D2_PUNGR|nr:hypothetical protein CDL15_Pgr025324 [Punica granatum]
MSRHRRQASRLLPPDILAGDDLQRPISPESNQASKVAAAASLGLGHSTTSPGASGTSAAGKTSAADKAQEGDVSAYVHSPATLKKPPGPKNT